MQLIRTQTPSSVSILDILNGNLLTTETDIANTNSIACQHIALLQTINMATDQITSKGGHGFFRLANFKQMSSTDRDLYAQILCCQPEPRVSRNSEWWQEYYRLTKKQIKALPAHLREYPNWLDRQLNKHIEDETRVQVRYLCPLHDQMSRILVRSILNWIRKEVDHYTPSVISPLIEEGHLSTNVVQRFTKLSNISAMWIAPHKFVSFYKREVDPKWEFQKDGCAACIIARMASDPEILISLKAGMHIRAKAEETKDPSRRMQYVECMIFRLPCDNTENIKEEANDLGRSLQIMLKKWAAGQVLTSTPLKSGHESNSLEPQNRLVTPAAQPSVSSPSSNKDDVKPKTSEEYEPIPWRVELANANKRRDTIDNVIDQYHRATIEPSFIGRKNYFSSKEDDEDEYEDETLYSSLTPSNRVSGSVYSQAVLSRTPEINRSGACDIHSLKGSIRRTGSLSQPGAKNSRKGAMTIAHEYQELTDPNLMFNQDRPSLPLPAHPRKSIGSVLSRASSGIEDNFPWDKINLGREDATVPDRNTKWSNFIRSSNTTAIDDILGYSSNKENRKKSLKGNPWCDVLADVSEED
jgi:hypothetical protein